MLAADKTKLERRVAELQTELAGRDEKLRLARLMGSSQDAIAEEELQLVLAELRTVEEEKAHDDTIHHAHLGSVEAFAAIDADAATRLARAHADRSHYESLWHEEQLGRRADVHSLHNDLLSLRNRLESDFRKGLEGFRERYAAEAEERIGAEARDAIGRRYELELYATKEHSWAGTWQQRYETLKKKSDDERRCATPARCPTALACHPACFSPAAAEQLDVNTLSAEQRDVTPLAGRGRRRRAPRRCRLGPSST